MCLLRNKELRRFLIKIKNMYACIFIFKKKYLDTYIIINYVHICMYIQIESQIN